MKIFKAKINNSDGVKAISLVESPATEQEAILQSADTVEVKQKINEEKQLMTTAVLIPDQLIYRNSNFYLGECYISYSKDVIEQAAYDFVENNSQKITLQHESEITEGASLVESWVSQDSEKDKSVALGFDLPVGTWYVTHHIDDEELWSQVKNGEITGTSIEAFFSFEEEIINQKTNNMDEEKIVEKVVGKVKSIFQAKEDKEAQEKKDAIVKQAADFNLEALAQIVDVKEDCDINIYVEVRNGKVDWFRKSVDEGIWMKREEAEEQINQLKEKVSELEKDSGLQQSPTTELSAQEHEAKLSKVFSQI